MGRVVLVELLALLLKLSDPQFWRIHDHEYLDLGELEGVRILSATSDAGPKM